MSAENLTYSEAFYWFDNMNLHHFSDLDQAAYHAMDQVLLADGDVEQRWFSVTAEKKDEAYQKVKAILVEYAKKANQPHPPTTPDANKEA